MTSKETHLLAYLTWDRVVPWKVLALKDPNKKLFPFAYGSGQRIFCNSARKGTVLWVVTVPRLVVGDKKNSSGRKVKDVIILPPTLVARLQITSFLRAGKQGSEPAAREKPLGPGVAALLKQWGAVATAEEEGSIFFGPNDATGFLNRLVFRSERKAKTLKPDEKLPKSEQYMSYAYRLQSIRHIDVAESGLDPGVLNPLGPQSDKTVFLSYVHDETSKYPAALAAKLLALGWCPWFDSLSIPGYRTSKRRSKVIAKQEHTSRLASLIEDGICHCKIFLSFRDKDYDLRQNEGEGCGGNGPGGASWVRYERDLASGRRLRMGHIDLGQVDESPPVFLGERWPSYGEDPRATAAKLAEAWDAGSS